MASCVRNVCAKNRENPSIPLKVTIDNVGIPFLRHSVYAFLHIFLHQCLTGGVSVLLVDNVVLQLLGLLITYFLLVVQMTASSHEPAAAYNVTTASMFTTVGTN